MMALECIPTQKIRKCCCASTCWLNKFYLILQRLQHDFPPKIFDPWSIDYFLAVGNFNVKLRLLLRVWEVYFAKRKNGLAAAGGGGCTPQLTRISHLAPQCQNLRLTIYIFHSWNGEHCITKIVSKTNQILLKWRGIHNILFIIWRDFCKGVQWRS